MNRSHLPRTALAVTIALGLAACGSDRDDSVTAQPTAAPTTVAVTTTQAPVATDSSAPRTTAAPTTTVAPTTTIASGDIPIVGFEYSYNGVPQVAAVGSKLVFNNISEREVHEIVAWRVADTETRPVEQLIALPQNEWTFFDGAPVLVSIAGPGQSGTVEAVFGDGTLSKPGRYVFYCTIPTGLDPAKFFELAAKSPGGPVVVDGLPPHYTKGMYGELTVV